MSGGDHAADDRPVTPSLRLDGRRAAVTGAGRGIGLACARALAQAGAAVTLLARSEDEIAGAAAVIREEGGAADHAALDVADTAAAAAFFAERPAFHVLVNNAGTARHANYLDAAEADFDAVFAINVRGAYFAGQAAAKAMARDGVSGSIIQMSSQMGHVGGPERSVYCASKAALEGMTKAMAIDLAPHGIRVNTICPTFVETPLTRPILAAPGFRDFALASIPLGRFGRLEDMMGVVVFLASDASAMFTGGSLMADGGWTAR